MPTVALSPWLPLPDRPHTAPPLPTSAPLPPSQIDPSKKGQVIGSGGRIINQIKEVAGASGIDIDEDGNVEVTASSAQGAAAAVDFIGLVVDDPPVGKIFRCVCGMARRGAELPVGLAVGRVFRCACCSACLLGLSGRPGPACLVGDPLVCKIVMSVCVSLAFAGVPWVQAVHTAQRQQLTPWAAGGRPMVSRCWGGTRLGWSRDAECAHWVLLGRSGTRVA